MVVVRLDTSRASELALTNGDVVHAVNGAWVTTPAELREALARFETGESGRGCGSAEDTW
jgi:S1-C subfamily serine protease